MSPHSKKIGAVILAAGGSSRFGEPKQLIPFRGKSLVRHIIDEACEAGCSPVVVVIGSEGEKLHRELDRTNVITAQNHQWKRGIALRETTGKSIVASSYADTLGVPALFDRSLFPELLSLGDKAGAKSIISRNRNRVEEFAFSQGEVDIDTWEDWAKLDRRSHPARSEGSP